MKTIMWFYYGINADEWLLSVKHGWRTNTTFYESCCEKFGYRGVL